MVNNIKRMFGMLFARTAFPGRIVRPSAILVAGFSEIAKRYRTRDLQTVQKVEYMNIHSYILSPPKNNYYSWFG